MSFNLGKIKRKSFHGAKRPKKHVSAFKQFILDVEDTVVTPVYREVKSATTRVYSDGRNLVNKYAETASKVSTDLSSGIGKGVQSVGESSGSIAWAAGAALFGFFMLKG